MNSFSSPYKIQIRTKVNNFFFARLNLKVRDPVETKIKCNFLIYNGRESYIFLIK